MKITRRMAQWFLDGFARDRRVFPVEFARIAVKTAGEMGLVSLEPRLRKLMASFPKPRGARAAKNAKFGELRADLRVALRKLASVADPDALAAWAASRQGDYVWAVRHLRKLDQERYLQVLDGWAEKEEGKRLRHIYDEFKRLDPARAKALLGEEPAAEKVKAALSPVENAKLIEDEKERVAALVAVALDSAAGWGERSDAIHLLVPWREPLRHADPSVDEALVRLLDTLWGDKDGEYVADDVFEALALRRRREHFDRMLERLCKFESYHFGDALKAVTDLARMAGKKEREALAEFLKPHLRSTKMDINHIIRSAWQADLRELKPDLERIATSGPDDYEGDKTFRSGGEPSPVEHRYHLARKVVSVWNEEDPLTRAKLLIAFAGEKAGLEALAAELGPDEIKEVEAFLNWLEQGRN